MVDTRTVAIFAVVIFFAGFGLLHFVAKDWLWDRHEATLRARGIVNTERTPEWENQQNLTGGAMLVVALLVLIMQAW